MKNNKNSSQVTSVSSGTFQSNTLDDIRKKIDELDNRIHDTLMERADLVLQVGEEKRKNNIQIVQPAREARMIRRLLDRHSGVLPRMAVVRIWRELVGAVSLLQTGLQAAIAMPDGQNDYWNLARDYFGSCLPFQKTSTSIAAISMLNENKTTFAVVPWPSNEEDQPWWTYLTASSDKPLQIIVALPHGLDPDVETPDIRALVVSKSGFDSSGDDNSFLLIQCAANISRGKLIDLAKNSGLTALGLFSKRNTSPSMPSLHLMEVQDYVVSGDNRLKSFLDSIEDNGANIICMGGYPVPPRYERTIIAK